MSRRAGDESSQQLFMRWLALVYIPLGVLTVLLLVAVTGRLPGWGWIFLLLFAGYSVIAVRLILERRKRNLEIPAPRSILIGAGAVAILVGVGVLLFIAGMNRLSSWGGLALAAVGGFLMILSVTVPFFKLVDLAIKGTGGLVSRGGRERRRTPRS